MAETIGERLLSEVEYGGLDQLLSSLRSLDQPTTKDSLGIPIIDEILNVFTNPPSKKNDFPVQAQLTDTRVRAPVLEICAVGPCSGKTQLLYQLAAVALGYQEKDDSQSMSSPGAVIWIDTDSRLDVYRLQSITNFRKLDQSGSSTMRQQASGDLTAQSLQHLHIFRPWSSAILLATLNSIPDHLFSSTKHFSGARPLKLIIINNISAFFNQDRLESESEVNVEGSSITGRTAPRHDSSLHSQRFRDIISSLQRLQRTFSCGIVAGNIHLAAPHAIAPGTSSRSHLPGAWTSFCPAKILVSRKMTPKFVPGMSVEEAKLESLARKSAVMESGFHGWVDQGAESMLEMEIRAALGKLESFRFFISEQGVHFGRLDDEKE